MIAILLVVVASGGEPAATIFRIIFVVLCGDTFTPVLLLSQQQLLILLKVDQAPETLLSLLLEKLLTLLLLSLLKLGLLLLDHFARTVVQLSQVLLNVINHFCSAVILSIFLTNLILHLLELLISETFRLQYPNEHLHRIRIQIFHLEFDGAPNSFLSTERE